MINLYEVAETNEMIAKENLDVRTITLGISLLDCIDSDLDKLNENVYRKITTFLGNENKKFQISKVEKGARSREYVGTIEWLNNAGIINVCYCLEQPELPLKGNYNPDNYRIYYRDKKHYEECKKKEKEVEDD